MELPSRIDIIRRLFDEKHIDLQEMLILLTDDDSGKQVAIPISSEDFNKVPTLFILK